MDQPRRLRPSLWHCLWGAPLLLAGIGLFVYILFHGITHATDSLTQVVVPGTAELQLQRGLYTVFLEEESVVNGKVYSTTQPVDGLACHVSSIQNGSAIAVSRPGMNTTYSVGGRSGHSVLEFSIQQNGRYRFACGYGENATGPDIVLAVGSGVGEALWNTIVGGFAAFFGALAAGLVPVLIVVIMRRREMKKLIQSRHAQI
jgi:hypothetical protein